MSKLELKPCQRCGSDNLSIVFDELFEYPYYVICRKCRLEGEKCEIEEIAVENWNTLPLEYVLRARIVEQKAELAKAKDEHIANNL